MSIAAVLKLLRLKGHALGKFCLDSQTTAENSFSGAVWLIQ